MAGHSAFGNDLIKHVALGNTAIKKIALGNDIVWSGASLVSYYDGSTLLGQREVDEGQDVLRPSGLTAQNLIPYPYAHGTSVIQGITFTVNADGSVRAQGTSTGVANLILTGQLPLVAGHSYKLVGCPTGGSYDTYQICDENTGWVNDIGQGDTFVADNISQHNVFKIRIGSGVTIDKVFKPMLVDATLFPDVTYNDFVLYGMNKTGYTHVGWTGYGGTERFETKVATGEPMALYALWLPNSLVVLSATIGNWTSDSAYWHYQYNRQVFNTKYVSGTTDNTVMVHWSGQSSTATNFTIKKGLYGTAMATFNLSHAPQDVGALDWGQGYVDDASVAKGNSTRELSNGVHTMRCFAQAYGDYRERVVICITNITLTNPTKWA